MTVSEPWPADGPQLSEDAPAARDDSPGRLHQPWRIAVVAAEAALAVLLVLVAWQAWQRGIVPIEVPAPNGGTAEATKSVGSWWTASVGAVVLAGLVGMDALRHLTLAWR